MTPPKKPEWFELADNDNATSIRKVSKTLPVIALGSALLIIGAGVVFAQSQNEAPASAVGSSNISASQFQSTPITPPKDDAPVAINSIPRVQSIALIRTPPTVSLPSQAPGIQAPTGHGEHESGEDD
jgi:hypothetical protein